MITASASLAELAAHGSRELAPYLGRQRPPETGLEWLGIAVTRLPDVAQHARTSDEMNARPLRAKHLHEPFADALTDSIAGAAALAYRALESHLEHHARPGGEAGSVDEDVEAYATLLVDAHRTAPRRAEFLIGGFASFLGGAIEAAGALADAELALGRKRRWDRSDPERLVKERAAQVYSALVNAVGGLLAYARLTAEDADRRR